MRKVIALGLVFLSGALLFKSGMNVYSSLSPSHIEIQRVAEFDRIEGKNCPLFFPKGQ
ncbi:hypothetical protein [Maridesulfovibrio frigidus]|uniref:hypothetical protein n=1 Tax=Maridesulfovibrio frigidus TaxID=340956 RepID=UPI000AC68754|nr:hypothetical protein [Maridesulfovibrio frigidus]